MDTIYLQQHLLGLNTRLYYEYSYIGLVKKDNLVHEFLVGHL